jgi:hypothetical protein
VDEVQGAIDAAYAHNGTVVIDFRVEREVNVFPMVPTGASIGEMMLGEPPESHAPGELHGGSHKTALPGAFNPAGRLLQ